MWWSIVGMGATALISSTDGKTALKGYQVWEDGKIRASCEENCEKQLAREAAIYEHLGEYPQVLRCFGIEEVHPGVHSLRLEFASLGDVRTFIQRHKGTPLPERTRLRMALDTAQGFSYVHARGVYHCDITCRNLFLFQGFLVKIGDFGSSIIKGSDEFSRNICEESAYELPCRGREFGSRPDQQRELFALGSAIYEIMTWNRPYEGKGDDEIEMKYAAEEFPVLEGVLAGDIIKGCWNEDYQSADEIVKGLYQVFISLDDKADLSKAVVYKGD